MNFLRRKNRRDYIFPARFKFAVQIAYAADFLDCFFLRGLAFGVTFLTHFSSIFGIFLAQKKAPDNEKARKILREVVMQVSSIYSNFRCPLQGF